MKNPEQFTLPLELIIPTVPRRTGRRARAAFSRGRTTGIGCMTLLVVFFVAVSAFGLTYQYRPVYKIDLGEPLDRPFVYNFNDRESVKVELPDGSQSTISFRWSKATSYVNLPGLGSQPVSLTLRYTPASNPKTELSVFVNEKNQAQLSPPVNQAGWLSQSFQVPAAWFADGHLHLKFKTAAFLPKGDSRELGLAFDSLVITPVESGKAGFIRPPNSVFLALIFGVVLALMIFMSVGMPPVWALGVDLIVIAGLSYWLANDRLSLTSLLERDFVRTLFFMWVSSYLVAEYLPRLFRWLGLSTGKVDGGWLAGLFLLQFTVLYFVQIHPLFKSSDLGLHEHKIQSILAGNLIFTEPLPGGLEAPYPPALYMLLQPFTAISGSSDAELGNLIMLANSILTASGVFLVYYLAALLRAPISHLIQYQGNQVRIRSEQLNAVSPDWAALIAAGLYVVNRYQFLIFSQGNHANLFGSWMFLFSLCVLVGTLNYLRHPRPRITPVPETGGPVATRPVPDNPPLKAPSINLAILVQRYRQKLWPLIGRATLYGLPIALLTLVFLSHYGTFLFTNFFLLAYLLTLLVLGGKPARQDAIYVALIWLVALMLSLALYYYNFVQVIASQVSGGSGQRRGSLDPLGAARGFWVSSRDNFGLIVLIAALGGLSLWAVDRLKQPDWWRLGPVGAALVALTLTSLAFVLAEAIQRESRYQLYFVTALVIPAGYFLGRVWRTGWPGKTLVVGLFLFQFLGALLFWLDRIAYYL